MNREELIEALLEEQAEQLGVYLGAIYDDDYVNFEGVYVCEELVKCSEDEDGVAFSGNRRDFAAEARFLKKHLDGSYQKYQSDCDDEATFDDMAHMQYRSKCGLFEVRVCLLLPHKKEWGDLEVIPAIRLTAAEFDAHMKKHYPLWASALQAYEDEMELCDD